MADAITNPVGAIKQQLQSDGYQVANVAVKNDNGNLLVSFPTGISNNEGIIREDFQLDADGDLNIAGGDFTVGPSDVQHVEDIIESFAGMWKQNPLLGVGIKQFLNSQTV